MNDLSDALLVLVLAAFLGHAFTLLRWRHGWRKSTLFQRDPRRKNNGQAPVFEVVVPVRNEAERIGTLLDDLKASLGPMTVRVWVIDDWSDDDTVRVAKSHPLAPEVMALSAITSQEKPQRGKKSALLAGIEHASSPWVVTLDADVRLGPGWARAWQGSLAHIDESCGAVAGPVRLWTGTQSGRWAEVQALDYAAQMGWSAAALAHGQPASASGANFAVRRSTYPDTRNLGASGDDALVVQSLHRQGLAVSWLSDPDAIVSTDGALDLVDWTHQRMRWAGKAKHYSFHVKRTAAWVIFAGLMPMVCVVWWGLSPSWTRAFTAVFFWMVWNALNVAFVRPVAQWFGLPHPWQAWWRLAWSQPFQLPFLMLASWGWLSPWGIASKPQWKGRTCTT
tara:strand:+ start:1628 stop:2806 length:1179 start_codon:yes stop_codon:yes gene_type:complete